MESAKRKNNSKRNQKLTVPIVASALVQKILKSWRQGSVKLDHNLVVKELSSTRVFETLLILQSWVVDRKYSILIIITYYLESSG